MKYFSTLFLLLIFAGACSVAQTKLQSEIVPVLATSDVYVLEKSVKMIAPKTKIQVLKRETRWTHIGDIEQGAGFRTMGLFAGHVKPVLVETSVGSEEIANTKYAGEQLLA